MWMMPRCALPVAALLASACAHAARTPTPAALEVAAAERTFAADAKVIGVGPAFARHVAPDGIAFSVDSATGRPVILNARERLAQRPSTPPRDNGPTLEWWPTHVGVASSGDLGFTTGPYFLGELRSGWIFTIWQRQPDGSWKWFYDGGPTTDVKPPRNPDAEPTWLPMATARAGSSEKAIAEVAPLAEQIARDAASDSRAALQPFLAADARLMGSSAEPATTSEARLAEIERWGRVITLSLFGARASRAGDMVFTYGSTSTIIEGQTKHGGYMHVWQKRAEGWRIVFAQVLQAPPPPPPPKPS